MDLSAVVKYVYYGYGIENASRPRLQVVTMFI